MISKKFISSTNRFFASFPKLTGYGNTESAPHKDKECTNYGKSVDSSDAEMFQKEQDHVENKWKDEAKQKLKDNFKELPDKAQEFASEMREGAKAEKESIKETMGEMKDKFDGTAQPLKHFTENFVHEIVDEIKDLGGKAKQKASNSLDRLSETENDRLKRDGKEHADANCDYPGQDKMKAGG